MLHPPITCLVALLNCLFIECMLFVNCTYRFQLSKTKSKSRERNQEKNKALERGFTMLFYNVLYPCKNK